MVDITLIKETITELLSANVDKETIFATLKDIGVDDSDVEKYYNEVVNAKTPEVKTEEKPKVQEIKNFEDKPKTEEIKKEIPKPTTTTEELEDATKDVIDIETQNKEPEMSSTNFIENTHSSENNAELQKQILEIDEKLSDLKAQMNGLTKIMKDILEENRNILNKLK